jgi:D-alanyl-D-alanine carboxypeptidase/D-alanyl-D-alanine-endopeptidase (penicillin-binding protein 4)
MFDGLAFVFAVLAPWAGAVAPSLDTALAAAPLQSAYTGAFVVDADSGATVYARNENAAFLPASTFKLLVGSAALAQLGPQFAFTTEVYARGTIAKGTLAGDLYFRGGGDATLGPREVADAARAIRDAGITRVTGSIVTDATHYSGPRYPRGWSIDDAPYDYAAPVSALSYNDNAIAISLSAGSRVGGTTTARIDPSSDAFAVRNESTTGPAGSPDTTDLARAWNDPWTILVRGTYPIDAKEPAELDGAVPDPSRFAADALAAALRAQGVVLSGGIRTNGALPAGTALLWTHRSAPFAQLLASFWQPSDNLIGELILNELGSGAQQPKTTQDAGVERERAWLASIGVDPAAVTIADGSGLSQYDRITPAALVAILAIDYKQSRSIVFDALPVAGERGTLKRVFTGTPLAGELFAKTGSMSHTHTLAGYVRTRRHGTLIFALLVNNWMLDGRPESAATVRALQQRFLESLIEA